MYKLLFDNKIVSAKFVVSGQNHPRSDLNYMGTPVTEEPLDVRDWGQCVAVIRRLTGVDAEEICEIQRLSREESRI
jgi:hypothetical protein